jgi:hypothetical protein
MATNAAIGYGSAFAVGDGGSPEVFTDLGEIITITGPAPVRETVDATHMASPNRYREHIAGLIDGGEVSVEMNYLPGGATEILLNACLEQVLPRNYRITTANTEALAFSGFCTSRSAAIPLDDKMTLSATFKVSGDPAFMSIS